MTDPRHNPRARIVEDIAGDALAAALISRRIPFTRTGQNEFDIDAQGRNEDMDLIADALIGAAAMTIGTHAPRRGLFPICRHFVTVLVRARRMALAEQAPRPPRTGLIGLVLFGLGLAALIASAAARLGGAG